MRISWIAAYKYPVLFALLPCKKGTEHHYLLTLLRNLSSFLSQNIMKDEYDAAVVSAVNKVFPNSVITGCNFNLSQCLGKQLQNIGLTGENKENEYVRPPCRMCAPLACLPINKVEEYWLIIKKMFHKMRN